MNNSLSLAKLIPIGLMLFSSFFGAGNLIFPPLFGFLAGSNLSMAALGFCITGVGLPLIGVLAIAFKGTDNVNALMDPVSKTYAKVMMFITALTIGPLFAIPRTAAVSYEVGIKPLLNGTNDGMYLAIYSALFFIATAYVALNPSKVVTWLGKILTPVMLLCLGALFISVFMAPAIELPAPQGDFATAPFLQGFVEGYNTMDLLAASLFGAVTVSAIKLYGITDRKQITRSCFLAGIVATVCLAVIYYCLAYAGAESVRYLGEGRHFSNGSGILIACTTHYLGTYGQMILGVIILLACLTTSIGLTAAISDYFGLMSKGKIAERTFALGITIFSFAASNIGLDNIISFAVPVLCVLYPIIITSSVVNILGPVFNDEPLVYRYSLVLVTIFACIDGIKALGVSIPGEAFLQACLPLYADGFGWLTMGIAGMIIGFIHSKIAK